MSRHKELRQQAALTEHLLRMGTKPALTDLPQLPGGAPARDGSPSVTPTQRKETPPKPASLPQATSATKKPCPLVSSQQSTVQAKKGARAASTTKMVTKSQEMKCSPSLSAMPQEQGTGKKQGLLRRLSCGRSPPQ